MRIGILTLPLVNNYGGYLQAWALQQTLTRLGHEAILLNRRRNDEHRPVVPQKGIKDYAKDALRPMWHILKRLLGRMPQRYMKEYDWFMAHDITPKTDKLYSTEELNQAVMNLRLDAIVVGSDQVWRRWTHDPNFITLKDFFLSFLDDHSVVKRVAYAASFGIDKWELNDEETKDHAVLAKRFVGISVREDSGVRLCNEYLHVKAQHVLDPTMLMDVDDYQKLIAERKTTSYANTLSSYILDSSDEIKSVLQSLSVEKKLPWRDLFKDYVVPPSFAQWLRAFSDATMIVTDSFHGTVFSILFNKPFVVLGNELRGQARFVSLLKIFGLEDRLVSIHEPSRIKDVISEPVDWERVNRIRQQWREKSMDFLNRSLSLK